VLGRTIAVVVTLALVAGFLVGLSHFPRPEEDARATLARLVLPDLGGEPMPMTQWRGKVVVVNFWASWCPPCRDEVPGLIQTQRELGANGLQVVGIAVDSADQTKAAAAEWGINYPVLVGGAAAIDLARRLGNPTGGLPYTVVVDRSGALVVSHLGAVSQANLARMLAAPLGL
jgi:thiol-disulfide isomerase/thioredoxin